MGIFSKLAGVFRRKKKEDLLTPLPPLPPSPTREFSAESVTTENVKARMDLVLTQMDSLRVQYETLNEKITSIEKMLKELYALAKSS